MRRRAVDNVQAGAAFAKRAAKKRRRRCRATHSNRRALRLAGASRTANAAARHRRLNAAGQRGDASPLGSGALADAAGNRSRCAREVSDSARATAGSIDAVADRDLAADYLFSASLLLASLALRGRSDFLQQRRSRLHRTSVCTGDGSSRMPPGKSRCSELVRGHAARSIGELTGFLARQGHPTGVRQDLQLDKEPLFRTRDTRRRTTAPR